MNQQTFLLRKSIFVTLLDANHPPLYRVRMIPALMSFLNFLSDLVIAVVSMNAKVRIITIAITYHRVLHMVVERSRVLLGICKDFYEIIRSRSSPSQSDLRLMMGSFMISATSGSLIALA